MKFNDLCFFLHTDRLEGKRQPTRRNNLWIRLVINRFSLEDLLH